MDSQLILSQKKQKKFCGSKIELLSPAKINLYLNIIGKYAKGYHRLESIAERISLFDKIYLEVIPKPIIEFSCNLRQLESKENLAYKAAESVRKNFNIPLGFRIRLEKNIPIGSGLGGASSNAALIILGIKELFSLRFCRDELYSIGEKLGSDVNFFLSEASFAYLSGRGQKVEVLPKISRLNHFILWPRLFLSTKSVYQNTKAKLTSFLSNVNIMRYALNNSDHFLLRKSVYNCLEKSAFSLCGNLARVKKTFTRQNISLMMTGSGSALYTVGLEDRRRLEKIVPDKWVVYQVRTF